VASKKEPEGDDATFHSSSNFHVWDSRYGPSTQAFSVFRETICNTFMPWTPEVVGDNFEGRVESISLDKGVVGRVRMTPIVATKTKSNIAHSVDECIHGNFILSGELKVVQGGRTNIAKPGDLVLYHSFSPVTLTVKSDDFFDNLAFVIPTSQFAAVPNAEDHFCNCLLSKRRLIEPLDSCLALLTKNLYSSSPDELSSLFNACVALLPLAAGRFGSDSRKTEIPKIGHLLHDIHNFIDENISEEDLSPRLTAEHFGVSIRYVQKLLAHSGTTFGTYTMGERLQRIKSEMIAFSGHRVPISVLAFQWGFSDLSTFNRAFKDRFGCTPSHFRGHSAIDPRTVARESPTGRSA
jgi:AraC-like DNA-binding protein